MKCESPYQRRLDRHQEFWQEFPCGRCLSCRINRAEEWTFRIRMELEDKTKEGDFITLTFDDEKSTPQQRTWLDKNELVKFIKRLRKGGLKLKYFACGEYGEKHQRAHYHAIIIRDKHAIPFSHETEYYEKYWTFGTVDVGTVTSASTRYVTGYLTKANACPEWATNAPPFQLQSQGLGKDWVEKHPEAEHTLRENNKWIPKYYRDKVTGLELPGNLSTKSSMELLILSAQGKIKLLHKTSKTPGLTTPEQMTHRRNISTAKTNR